MSKLPINIERAELNIETKKIYLTFKTYDTVNNRPPLKVVIDNQNTFICKNEYSSDAYTYNITWDSSDTESLGENQYRYNADLEINVPELNAIFLPELESNLYFLYIYSTGESTEPYLEAVVPLYYEYSIYKTVFDSIKNDFAGCSISCKERNNSSSSVILLKGFEYALVVGDYKKAITFWNTLHTNISNVKSNCNCI